jgi:Tol biopolymer transport system component
MKFQSALAVVFALMLIVASSGYARQTAGRLLQSGLYQEQVKGDLDAAIKVYERIIVNFPKNRPIVAKALLQIGLCYEKLGVTEAQKTYQRLIEEYTDQPDTVAQARARLSKLGAASVMSTRQVWSPAKDAYAPSPDGRYLTYIDWTKGNLALHNLETGENRDLTDEGTWETPSQFCDVSIWSPDSRQIAYCWIDTGEGTDLRIVGLDGLAPRVLHSDPESGYAWPRAWSHDGKHIAAIFCNRDAPKQTEHIDKIALVSVADGSMRILKTLGNRRSRFMSFSPDDRYLAYQLETEEGSRTHDIHLLAIDGSQDIPLIVHPANDGSPFWSPDGKCIIFVSDRSGSKAIWMLDMDEGKSQGTPKLVKEMGEKFYPMGLTPDGSLYYDVGRPAFDVYAATLDFDAGKVSTPPTKTSLRFEGSNYAPSWSRDGKYLVYASQRNSKPPVLVIRSVETGQERDISFKTMSVQLRKGQATPQWSPDGGSILVTAFDRRKNSRGLYLVDAKTGNLTSIVQGEPKKEGDEYAAPRWPVFSSDGKHIYYVRGDRSIVARNLETRRVKELSRTNTYIYNLALSPDGRRLAFLEAAQALRPKVVKTMPASGGEASELYRLKEGKRFSWGVGLSWTPDGDHVVVGAPDAPDKPDELWSIPVTGGEPRKLNLGVKVNHVSLHPDGRRIAFTQPESGGDGEVWVMENFLPESKASE